MDANELSALRDSFREVLQAECPIDRVLRHVDGDDLDPSLWRTFAELGWTALSVPEAQGGLGLGAQALSALYHELGRALAPASLLPTLLTGDIVARFGSAVQHDRWLGELVTGERRVTMMLPEAIPLDLKLTGDMITISGTSDELIDARHADWALLLCARDGGEPVRVLVDLAADGVQVTLLETVDATRSFGRVTLERLSLPADRIVAGAGLEEAIWRHGALAMAADAAGGGEMILDLTIDYLKTREQFGRAIGSFQALKHRCADHKMALVEGGMLLDEAVEAAAHPSAGWIELSAAKVANCDRYAALAQDAVQLHGGIGFTWEHLCHLFLKRAKLDQAIFGNSPWHLDHIADRLAA